jgi:hypothetical protein
LRSGLADESRCRILGMLSAVSAINKSVHESRYDVAGEEHQTEKDTEKVLVARGDAGTPAWELLYDDPQTTTILHHHGAAGVPASFTDQGNGRWVAQCSECGASLEVLGTAARD